MTRQQRMLRAFFIAFTRLTENNNLRSKLGRPFRKRNHEQQKRLAEASVQRHREDLLPLIGTSDYATIWSGVHDQFEQGKLKL